MICSAQLSGKYVNDHLESHAARSFSARDEQSSFESHSLRSAEWARDFRRCSILLRSPLQKRECGWLAILCATWLSVSCETALNAASGILAQRSEQSHAPSDGASKTVRSIAAGPSASILWNSASRAAH